MAEQQVHFMTAEVTDTIDDVVGNTFTGGVPDGFPGYAGVSGGNLPVDGAPGMLPFADAHEAAIDRISYGEHGLVGANSSGDYGPVEPNQVENHHLDGRVVKVPRRIMDTHGDVGLYDHNSYTALQVIQQVAADPTDQQSLMALLNAGV